MIGDPPDSLLIPPPLPTGTHTHPDTLQPPAETLDPPSPPFSARCHSWSAKARCFIKAQEELGLARVQTAVQLGPVTFSADCPLRLAGYK